MKEKSNLKKGQNICMCCGSNLLSKIILSDEWNDRLSRIKYYKIILEEEKSIKSSILNSIDNLNIEKEKALKKEEKNKKIYRK